jgi:uncharacterized membrane protein
MSFCDVTKYPPSRQYLCATLVVFALVDYALERRWIPQALGVVEVYGRVPFFCYVLHFYLLHVLAIVTLMVGAVRCRCRLGPRRWARWGMDGLDCRGCTWCGFAW